MNNFHGTIPGNFAKGCSVRNFNLNNNQLEGSLPHSLVNCIDLKILNVANNNLNDTFPHWLGDLDINILLHLLSLICGSLISLTMTSMATYHRNFLKILHAIRDANETKVEYLRDVYDRNMYYQESVFITTKGLEIQFMNILTTLTVIDFSNNRFNGQIPEVLGELHSLRVLNLSHNSLIGRIPSLLGNLSVLESLDLSSNKFEGRIPAELVNLIFLAVLNRSWNNLSGLIPQGNQFGTFTNDSYIGNLGLCGLPLSKSCSNQQNLQPQVTKFDEGDDTRELNWKFSILLGYGCGLVLGLSMGYIVFTTGKPWWFIRIIEKGQEKYVRRKIQIRRGGRKQHS
ncbi:Leucine-rich repeat - like 10 [Theobroma cacao]|nr:Leucine-rich repeat - like 10 [Theobroma cacao]